MRAVNCRMLPPLSPIRARRSLPLRSPNPLRALCGKPSSPFNLFALFATFVVSPPLCVFASWRETGCSGCSIPTRPPGASTTDPPSRPLRQTVFPVQSFRAFRDFRSFSPLCVFASWRETGCSGCSIQSGVVPPHSITDPPSRPLRQTVFPVHAFCAFRDFRSFSLSFPHSCHSLNS